PPLCLTRARHASSVENEQSGCPAAFAPLNCAQNSAAFAEPTKPIKRSIIVAISANFELGISNLPGRMPLALGCPGGSRAAGGNGSSALPGGRGEPRRGRRRAKTKAQLPQKRGRSDGKPTHRYFLRGDRAPFHDA